MSIDKFNFSVRTRNSLKRGRIRTEEQLRALDSADLLKLRGIGVKSLNEIQQKLEMADSQRREKQRQEPVPHGSYLHGYREGSEAMRSAVIRELTRMARRLNVDQGTAVAEACEIVKGLEVMKDGKS
jgi:hypothetical protein